MRLTHLLNKKIIIARLAISSGEKMTFSTVTAEMGHLQPMSLSKNELEEGVFGKTFRLYMDGEADVQEGDVLRDEAKNETYRVKSGGVTRRTFGTFDYLICILERTE